MASGTTTGDDHVRGTKEGAQTRSAPITPARPVTRRDACGGRHDVSGPCGPRHETGAGPGDHLLEALLVAGDHGDVVGTPQQRLGESLERLPLLDLVAQHEPRDTGPWERRPPSRPAADGGCSR